MHLAAKLILAAGLAVTASAHAAPFTVSVTQGAVTSCGTNCTQVQIGRSGTDYWRAQGIYEESASFNVTAPGLLQSVTLRNAAYDDWQQYRVNNVVVWNDPAGWTGDSFSGAGWNGGNHNRTINLDLTGYFTGGGSVQVLMRTAVDKRGEGQGYLVIQSRNAQCSDGADNDGDGDSDYPSDRDCTSADDDREAAPPPQCNDGADNDGDGRLDMSDPGCSESSDNDEADTGGVGCTGSDCICGADTDSDGYVDGASEIQACDNYSGRSLCPIQRQACTASTVPVTDPSTGMTRNETRHTCPADPNAPCIDVGSGNFQCSKNACMNRSSIPKENTDAQGPQAQDDGPRDAGGNCLGMIRIFPGNAARCRRSGTQTAFQNCCANKMARMGDTTGASGEKKQREYKEEASSFEVWDNQCDIPDQQTALLADSGYCIALGTYCAERWPLVGCVQRAQGYCCYNSKLARIVQEQGRPQIPSMGGFGTASRPSCRGFSAEEFQALDFSKMDLSDYYTSIKHQSQTIMQEKGRDAAKKDFDGGP